MVPLQVSPKFSIAPRHLCVLTWILFIVHVQEAVVITEFKVPEVVKHGSDVELVCISNLQKGEKLYTVKWYKENSEFYRFEPKQLRQVRYYQVPGIDIDKGNSNYTRIMLRKVNNATSGTFTCEVSVDMTLETDIGVKMMLVKDTSTMLNWRENSAYTCMSIAFSIMATCFRISKLHLILTVFNVAA